MAVQGEALRGKADPGVGSYVFLCAVAMSLGWGLRGYIGGGPFGAMIPGAFVALSIALFLGYTPKAASLAAALGAVGVAFGGMMTYGQTIGFLDDNATVAWGLTGLGLKGAVWGLLGGAVLGVGLCAHRLPTRQLAWALICFLAAAIVGIALINEPKLIYFSNRLDRPRDECWAGLLFGALAFLAYLSWKAESVAQVARRFGLYGLIGGGLGFFLGALFILCRKRVPEDIAWMPWWKYMEFTFGLLFGAALGLCAYRMRHQLRSLQSEADVEPPERPLPTPAAYLLSLAFVAAVFFLWPVAAMAVAYPLRGLESLRFIVKPIAEVLLSYTALGCLLILAARRSETLAWQTAATVTLLASVIDLVGDWAEGERGVYVVASLRWALVLGTLVLGAAAVLFWQRKTGQCLYRMTIWLVWALVGVAFYRAFSGGDILFPEPGAVAEAGGAVRYTLMTLEGRSIVQTLFTVLAILTTWRVLAIRSCGVAHAPVPETRRAGIQ